MREVTSSGTTVSGNVTVASAQNLKFLRWLYTSTDYPSLLGVS
jgi:hypothetical protein